MSIFTHDGREVRVRCPICTMPMEQSRNDTELFLCYQCNEKRYKNDIDVNVVIEPKQKPLGLSVMRDPIFGNINQDHIFAEPDITMGEISATGEEFLKEKQRQKDPIKSQIEQFFINKLNTKNINVELDDRTNTDKGQ